MQLKYETKHLILSIAGDDLAVLINDYLIRNREDFSKWDMQLNDSYFTLQYQRKAILAEQRIFMHGDGARYYMFLKGNPDRIIGNISFSVDDSKENITVFSNNEKNNNEPIKNFGHISEHAPDIRTCTIGYKTDVSERGKGYAFEAASFLLPIAAKDFAVKRFEAEVLPENLPSKALIEKLGFHFEKVIRNAHEFGDVSRDILLYVLEM